MTTIIYSHNESVIAYDSRTTAGALICTDEAEKSVTKKGVTFIFSGYPADNNKIIDSYFSSDRVIDNRVGPSAFAVDHKSKVVYLLTRVESELIATPVSHSCSVGSGGDFALSALDHGKTARESVKYAMTRDNCTGGRIRIIKI